MKVLLIFIWLLGGSRPDTLSLETCYDQLRQRFPLTDKYVLERQIAELKQKNLHTRYFPQFEVQGRASYQSHVTEINFTPPNIPVPQFNRDQYSAELKASQLIYGGGRIEARKNIQNRQSKLRQSQVDVSLHEVRRQVDRLFYNILRIEKNHESLQWTIKKIEAQLSMVESRVEHGALLASDLHILEAEKSKLEQQRVSLNHDRIASYRMLSELLDVKIDTATVLVRPGHDEVSIDSLHLTLRAEFDLFRHQKGVISARKEAVKAEKDPEFSAFATAGYGRPGLDRFDPDFQSYYIVGVQARWSLWDLLNADRELKQLELEQKQVSAEQRAFTRQLRSSLQQQAEEVKKLRKLMEKDRQIIKQRQKIVETSESQLKNGVITSSDYLEELYEAKRARLQLQLHDIELSYARTQMLTQMNKSWIGEDG